MVTPEIHRRETIQFYEVALQLLELVGTSLYGDWHTTKRAGSGVPESSYAIKNVNGILERLRARPWTEGDALIWVATEPIVQLGAPFARVRCPSSSSFATAECNMKALGPFYEYLVALGGDEYHTWYSSCNYHEGQELPRRRFESRPVHWKMFCYWLSLKFRQVWCGVERYDMPIPSSAVAEWYRSMASDREEVYLTKEETKVLVDEYLTDYAQLGQLDMAVSSSRRQLTKLCNQVAKRGATRYEYARRKISADRRPGLPHVPESWQPRLLPQLTGNPRAIDHHRPEPIDLFNLRAFAGGFSLKHGSETSTTRERVRLCRYLRERYGRETAFGHE